MSSLNRLQLAGINIVTSLLGNLTQLQSVIGITSTENKLNTMNCLEIVIDKWSNGQGHYPPTWRSLVEKVLGAINLNELSQQILEYMDGK